MAKNLRRSRLSHLPIAARRRTILLYDMFARRNFGEGQPASANKGQFWRSFKHKEISKGELYPGGTSPPWRRLRNPYRIKVFGSEAKKHPHICGKGIRNNTANMKKVLVFALLAVAAAPVFAAPPATPTCTGNLASQVISTNLDVPAGATCQLNWVEVVGNVTVEGSLISFSSRFDKNVTVTGGSIQIVNGFGDASKLVGNLTITGSAANSNIFCPNTTNVIGGNLSFTGNSGRLYVCQASVGGNVTVSDNIRNNTDFSGPQAADLTNITTPKNMYCDGNVPYITGSGNTAVQKTGQCSGL